MFPPKKKRRVLNENLCEHYFYFCGRILFGVAGVRSGGKWEAVSVHARSVISPYRPSNCLTSPVARWTNAFFVSGLNLFHVKRFTSSKVIHDVVDVNRSHFQLVREYFSPWLKLAKGWCVHSAPPSDNWEGVGIRKPPNNYGHCITQL